MINFSWTGKKDSVTVRGALRADSIEDAIAVLKNRGIDVEELRESSQRDTSAHAGHHQHQVFEHRISPTTNALAIISLIVSLLGVIVTWFVPLITQIVAIICGHIARSQIKRSQGNQTGSGMALAGLIISYLVLVIIVIGLVFIGSALIDFLSEINEMFSEIGETFNEIDEAFSDVNAS